MKKVALIIANKDFRDEEYFNTKSTLEQRGISTDTFSNQTGIAVGRFGREAQIDDIVSNINIDNYQGMAIIGGPGALERLDNEEMYSLIREFYNNNKIVAAICIAPVILAKAGILQDKQSTVWSSEEDRSAIKIIQDYGAQYVDNSVVVYNNIVTGKDFEASHAFGSAIGILLFDK